VWPVLHLALLALLPAGLLRDQQFPVGRDIFQERTPQPFILNIRGALLQ
jgi:hypothetical protein